MGNVLVYPEIEVYVGRLTSTQLLKYKSLNAWAIVIAALTLNLMHSGVINEVKLWPILSQNLQSDLQIIIETLAEKIFYPVT